MDTDLATIQAGGVSKLSKKQWGLLTGVSPRRWKVDGNHKKFRGGIKVRDATDLHLLGYIRWARDLAPYEGCDELAIGIDMELFAVVEEELLSRQIFGKV